jgi:hypothetical protein
MGVPSHGRASRGHALSWTCPSWVRPLMGVPSHGRAFSWACPLMDVPLMGVPLMGLYVMGVLVIGDQLHRR